MSSLITEYFTADNCHDKGWSNDDSDSEVEHNEVVDETSDHSDTEIDKPIEERQKLGQSVTWQWTMFPMQCWQGHSNDAAKPMAMVASKSTCQPQPQEIPEEGASPSLHPRKL